MTTQLGQELNAKHLCNRSLSITQPENGYLKIKANPHDFGTYYEVNAVYDMDDNEAYVWALSVERDEKGVLEFWEPEFNPHK